MFKPESCTVAKSEHSGGPLENETKPWHSHGWPQQYFPQFGFRTHTTAFSPMEQPSILSAKFDRLVAYQNISLCVTALLLLR